MFAVNCTRGASRTCYTLSRKPTNISHCLSTLPLPPSPSKNDDDREEHEKYGGTFNSTILQRPRLNNSIINCSNITTIREYHATSYRERVGPAVFLGLGAVAATAKAGQYAVQGYNEWKEASKLAAEEEAKFQEENKQNAAQGEEEDPASKQKTQGDDTNNDASSGSSSGSSTGKKDEKRENIFASFFNMSVGSKYYEGGFEEVMTRKEAALILGVRESSATKRIKEAHRKLLILNHPDTGGSTFIAGKINEAKELLLKGKKR
eukprot:CAMPEP_0196135126 /NCGR_PEP_ID=MMETSP0910-20130528/3871_1 /TAXON_ID=49265 /ORGANISM="Thalassiosira rotula, Strain GSO102" /LENGTH=262 /DNA_ID=CAMNT_0041395219 /DNA_START=86 /DNA_END=874 /DNA_ORIENTATION=+